MTKYKNIARSEQDEKELEELETEYRKEFGTEKEENVEPQVLEDDESWKKRYSDLRRYNSQIITDKESKEKEIAELKTKLASQENMKLPENTEEAEKWVQEYPDLSRVLMTLIEQKTNLVREEVVTLRQERESERRALERDRAMDAILKKHPDFLTLIEEDVFKQWVVDQPKERGPVIGKALYDALYNNESDAKAAIEAVNFYKQDQKKIDRQQDRSAGFAVNQRGQVSAPQANADGKKRWKESEIEKLNQWDWDKHETDIDLARREGRIVYDITGAAR